MPLKKKLKPKRIVKESFRKNLAGLSDTRWTKLTGPSSSIVIDVVRVENRTVVYRVSGVNTSTSRGLNHIVGETEFRVSAHSFLSDHSVYQYIGTVEELAWAVVGAFVVDEAGHGRYGRSDFFVIERMGAGRVYFRRQNDGEVQRNIPYAEFVRQFREVSDADATVPLPPAVRFEKIPRTISAFFIQRSGWYDFPWGRQKIDVDNEGMYYFDGRVLGGTVDGAFNAGGDEGEGTDDQNDTSPRPMRMPPAVFMRVYQPVVEQPAPVEQPEELTPAVSRFERVS